MDFQDIIFSQEGPLAVIQLNRPSAMNALSETMSRELMQALIEIKSDPSIRAVLLTGAGEAFCAGGDIKGFVSQGDALAKGIDARIVHFHGYTSRLVRLPKPIITAINGPAVGAGFSMAISGDMVLMKEGSSYLMQGYTRIGASPDGGSTYFLPRVVGLRRALELALTNRSLSPEEAVNWGIANRVLPADNFLEEAKKVALSLAEGPTRAFGQTRHLLYHSLNNTLETQLELEARSIVEMSQTKDFKEATKAFVEKRPPEFTGT